MGGGGTTETVSKTEYPPEYNALMKSASAKAQATADLPFSQYEGARVAGQSPDQQAAMDLARQSIGATDPIYNQAAEALQNYGGYSGADTASQLLQQYGRPDEYSGLQTAAPLLGAGAQALGGSASDYTMNVLNDTGANKITPDVISRYMSPYTNDVVDRIAQLGQRNLSENILPSLNKAFVGGGTFGGSRSAEFNARAARDANESIMGQQAQSLESGYGTALNAANADLNRLSGQATTLGNLEAGDLSRTIEGANTLGNTVANLGSQDASRQLQATEYMTGLGTQDANNQANLSSLLQQYGGNIYNQNLKDVSLLQGIGDQQQSQEQAQINAAMQKYLEEKNYPQEQLDTLLKPLKQIQWPTTQTNTSTAPSSNPFGQVLGGLLSVGSLAMPGASGISAGGNLLSAFKKRGGSVRVRSPIAARRCA